MEKRHLNEVVESHLRSLTGDRNVDRRTFVVTSLAAGFAAAVMPVSAQTITTSAEGLVAGEVKVKTRDGEMPAYRAMPATGSNFPVVLVVQEIFGVHEHIKDVCRRVAKAGYFAIAPELYARQGDPSKYTDIGKLVSEVVAKVPDAQVMSDLDACVAFARDSGKAETTRLGITGFCWGGRVVFMYAAHNPKVKAAVAWYGQTAQAFHVHKGACDATLSKRMGGLAGSEELSVHLVDLVRGAFRTEDRGVAERLLREDGAG